MRRGIALFVLLFLMIPGLPFAWSQEPSPKAAGKVSPAPEETTFAINEFKVEGNTVLPPEKVAGIVSASTGPAQRFSDVEKARTSLEAAYHEAGYPTVLVIVPEQTIEGGIVKLQVIESKLGRVEVVGNRHFLLRYILDRLPSLRPDALLYEPAVTEELNRINASPDIKITPVLSVGEIPGTVNLKLQVDDRLPLHASLEFNNRGTPNTPRRRLGGTVQYNNLFDRDQIITFQTIQTPQDWGLVSVYSLSYVIPLERRGHMIAVYGADSKSKSVLDGSALPLFPGDINIAGNATVFGGRYILPLSEKQGAGDPLSLGLDYKRLGKNEATFPGEFGTAVVNRRLYYTPLSAAFTGNRPDDHGTTRFSASVRGYVAGMVPGGRKKDFGGDPDDPANHPANRKGSTGTFAVLQAGVERSEALPQRFVFSAKLDGQWATEPLISAEQYFAGGVDTVRGYLENEALGDDAVHGSLELISPPLPEFLPPSWKQNLRLAVFYDAAYLWVKEAPAGQTDHFALTGFGLGLRLALTDYLQARIDQAWAGKATAATDKGDRFTHFLLRAVF